MKVLRLLATAKVGGYIFWPGVAVASQLTLGQAMNGVTIYEWGFVFFLITLGGLASLLQRISDLANEALEKGSPLKFDFSLNVMILSHLTGSWLAGLVSFFWAQHQQMPGFYIGLFVPLMSFGSIVTVRYFYGKFVGVKDGNKTE